MTDAKVKRINADGSTQDLPDQEPTLKDMQGWVDGYIEIVRLDKGRIMVVDEEGIVKRKPVNQAASELAQRIITGDAVIMPDDYLT